MNAIRVASLLALVTAPIIAQENPLEPKEHTVPWGAATRARDPILARDGKVWFVGQQGNYVAYLDSKSGEFKRYEIEAGTNPHNINIDERGGVWFTGNRNGKLYNIDPSNGAMKPVQLNDETK